MLEKNPLNIKINKDKILIFDIYQHEILIKKKKMQNFDFFIKKKNYKKNFLKKYYYTV